MGDVFGTQQVREYAASAPRVDLLVTGCTLGCPGLHWHRTHVGTGFSGPLPEAVLYVVRDMLALKRVPDVLPMYRDAVARRIKRERERALWEVRVAAQYAPAGIRAEWSAITDPSPGAPDVCIPAYAAEIQVKCLSPRAAVADDFRAIFGALDDALGQLTARMSRGSEGPGAIVIVLPGATSLDAWDTSDIFRNSMSLRLATPDYWSYPRCASSSNPSSMCERTDISDTRRLPHTS